MNIFNKYFGKYFDDNRDVSKLYIYSNGDIILKKISGELTLIHNGKELLNNVVKKKIVLLERESNFAYEDQHGYWHFIKYGNLNSFIDLIDGKNAVELFLYEGNFIIYRDNKSNLHITNYRSEEIELPEAVSLMIGYDKDNTLIISYCDRDMDHMCVSIYDYGKRIEQFAGEHDDITWLNPKGRASIIMRFVTPYTT